LSSGVAYDTNLITFTAAFHYISVYTTSSLYDDTSYSLKIIGTVTGFTTTASAIFTLNVHSVCSTTLILSNTIANYNYDIS
jgi:hypothetical protein